MAPQPRKNVHEKEGSLPAACCRSPSAGLGLSKLHFRWCMFAHLSCSHQLCIGFNENACMHPPKSHKSFKELSSSRATVPSKNLLGSTAIPNAKPGGSKLVNSKSPHTNDQ
ncbi:hypothetical protein ACLOJK_008101 [Asimina triloba]